ncbi:MAG: oligosaccharide flippase family protein, partial [Lachnospiraceae bacterium]|nr:oligosaccharide flippase family protein [Lachnospiraceae bacterium]
MRQENKQTIKNIFINILSFLVQFLSNLILTPLIVSKIGAIAYGYLGIANDFIMYASVLATVFNSVAARFIANSYYKKDWNTANCFFNSLIVANSMIAIVITLCGVVIVSGLEFILNIPEELLFDVKITFGLVILSYIVNLVTTIFTTSAFIMNRMDIQGARNILNYIIRLLLILICFRFISVKIYWVAFATFLANIFIALFNVKLTSSLTPCLKLDLKCVKMQYVVEVGKTGVWMTLTNISVILLNGIDLMVANRFLGEYDMGLLSVARLLPNNVTSAISMLGPVFTPVFVVCFAERDFVKLAKKIIESINYMAFIFVVPIIGFIVLSCDFYSLWQTSLNDDEIIIVSILSSVSVFKSLFDALTISLAQISVVSNKVKLPVLISLACGVISVVIEVILIACTDLGVYAIVLATTIVLIIRYILFNPLYASYCIKQPFYKFYVCLFKWIFIIPIIFLVFIQLKQLVVV